MPNTALIQKLNDIMEKCPLPIAVIRKSDLEFVDCNDEFCAVLGLNHNDSPEARKTMLEGLFALDSYSDFIGGECRRPIVFHKMSQDKEATAFIALVSCVSKFYLGEEIVFISLVDISEMKNDLVAFNERLSDPFTGFYNKAYLDEFLGREISRSRRLKNNLSLAMIDIDDLTGINETYGYLAGDEGIKHLAMLLHEYLRKTDVVFRFDAGKFLVLLTDCEKNEAFSKLEDIGKRFEAMAVECEGAVMHATFSAGIAAFPVHSLDKHEIVLLSEMALKDAKKNGRNMVSVYGKR